MERKGTDMASNITSTTSSPRIFIAALMATALSFIGTVYAIVETFSPSNETSLRIVLGIIAVATAATTLFFGRKMFYAIINA